MSERTLQEKKSQAPHHLMWTACQLMYLHDRLAPPRPANAQLRSALAHAAAIHTRCIMDFFGKCPEKAYPGDIVASHFLPSYGRYFTSAETHWRELYQDASKQVAHIGVNRISDRDVPEADRRKWARTMDVRRLVARIHHFMGRTKVQECYAKATFKHINKIEVGEFQARVRQFRITSRQQPSDGTISGEAAQVYGS